MIHPSLPVKRLVTSDLWVGQLSAVELRLQASVWPGSVRLLEDHVRRGTSGRLPLRRAGCLTHTAGGRAQWRGGLLGSGVQVPLYARSLTHSPSTPDPTALPPFPPPNPSQTHSSGTSATTLPSPRRTYTRVYTLTHFAPSCASALPCTSLGKPRRPVSPRTRTARTLPPASHAH